jgi:hypothetical protein
MSSFTNLLSRLDVISEAKVSPMDKILPGFQSQARLLAKDKGASSGTREGRLAMLAILFDLDIIDEAVVRMFKNDPSVSRMVDYFETNGISAKIREKSDDINDHIKNQLENKISFTTGNRTDDAQQRYEVNKLSNELKAAKKAARIEKKKETASAMADIVQTIDRYDDLVSSIEGSYSDKYMLEIVASADSELEDIAKIVSYIGRFTSDKDIDVDGRSIDVVFSSNSKLGRIVSKMGTNTVERKIADDLKTYGGAGVVIHEPDEQQSKEMVSLLKKAPVEDEEGDEFSQDQYSADYADDYADPYGPVDEGEEEDASFDSLAEDYQDVTLDPSVHQAQQKVIDSIGKGKQVNENASSTAYYLNEQTKRDSHTHVVKERAVSFRERYSPKTHWQLAELRSYGL